MAVGASLIALAALVVLAVLDVSAGAVGDEATAMVRDLAEQPDVSYSASFTWDCPWETWEHILDEPLLMGRLWEARDYAPAYRFSTHGDTLHVVDPTGLIGDTVLVSRGPGARTYLVLGKLDHWAVPVLNEGQALFVLTSHPVPTGVAADLQVKIRAGSTLGHLVLRLVKPLLARHVANRMDSNLGDGRHLAELVASAPDSALQLLAGGDADRFRRVFLP